MTANDKNKKRTDEAWLQLHGRLEEAGLLDSRKKASLFGKPAFRWVAVIAVICIISVFTIVPRISKEKPLPLITLFNPDRKNTLVTTLEDGSIVYLNNNTQLSYTEFFGDNTREVHLQGDAFFDIERNPDKPFVIETELARIEVLGTSFNIHSTDNSPFSLSVIEGEVKVTLKSNGHTSHIKAKQTAIVDKQTLRTIQTENENYLLAAYTSHIHFKNEPLKNIVKILNIHSNGSILELDPKLNDKSLTFTFSGEDMPTIAQLICTTLNLKYKETGNTIHISETK